MEEFFYEDRFCLDIGDLMGIFDIDEENLNELEEDWNCKVELSELEPMFQLTAGGIDEMLYNKNEERYTEDGEESEEIVKALNKCVDFEKLNSMIPKFYYPNNKFVTITKKDLIEYCS